MDRISAEYGAGRAATSSARSEPVISVRGLVKRYGGREAVAGIDLEVRRGEIFAGLLNVTPSSAPITELPLALIPTATVPLLFALHITFMVTLARAPRPGRSAAGPLISGATPRAAVAPSPASRAR